MSIYQNNLNAIKEKDNMLYQAVMDRKFDDEDIQLESVAAKDGTAILRITKDGKGYYMNSPYNPIQEAVKFANQYQEVIDYSVMFFLGIGNGIAADQIIQITGEHVRYLFYEPSPAIFLFVLEHFDLTELIENPNTRIIVKSLNDSYFDAELGGFAGLDNYKIIIYDALPKYKLLFPEDYKDMEDRYRYIINLIRVNIGTGKYFGKDTARNNIYNMRYLLHCNCEEEFEGVFPIDMPAILVAAGPSLEKNVHLLKEAKGKALIIAVDTALRYLVEQGVQPDIAVAADPRKPVCLFQNDKVRQIPLAIHSSVNYKAVELMAGQKIIYASSDNAYYDGIFQLAGRHMYSLRTGGSVSTLALSLAIAWGFRRLVLVGQDLALAPGKVHAGKDDIDTEKLTGELIEIEGYYGEPVYTSPDYKNYLDWYEMVVRTDDEMEVINATEGGAKIKGTVQMSLKEVIDTYCNQSFEFEQTIRNMPSTFSKDQEKELLNKWDTSVKNLEELGHNLELGIQLINQGIDIIREGGYSRDKVYDIHKRISAIVEESGSMDEIYFIDRMIAEKEEDVLSDIYEIEEDNDAEHCRMLEKLKQYLDSMCSAVEEVRSMFGEIIEEVKQD